uniref:Uncharacterized protein n=1 Tax=Anopheles culicifacies TaxID=139723 RepID=A0A182MMX4_9DIPT
MKLAVLSVVVVILVSHALCYIDPDSEDPQQCESYAETWRTVQDFQWKAKILQLNPSRSGLSPFGGFAGMQFEGNCVDVYVSFLAGVLNVTIVCEDDTKELMQKIDKEDRYESKYPPPKLLAVQYNCLPEGDSVLLLKGCIKNQYGVQEISRLRLQDINRFKKDEHIQRYEGANRSISYTQNYFSYRGNCSCLYRDEILFNTVKEDRSCMLFCSLATEWMFILLGGIISLTTFIAWSCKK